MFQWIYGRPDWEAGSGKRVPELCFDNHPINNTVSLVDSRALGTLLERPAPASRCRHRHLLHCLLEALSQPDGRPKDARGFQERGGSCGAPCPEAPAPCPGASGAK